MKANQTNNSENWPVCPECIGLNGSKKRNWMENHADFIVSYYEMTDLEQTCHYFNSKPDTMLRFLKRHDLGDKKLIRQDEITRNRVTVVDEKVYEIVKELERQDVTVTELISRGYQLTDIMLAWHKRQIHDHTIMVGYLEALTPNFTEQIYTDRINDSGPTPSITEQNSTKRIKAGPTSQVGRSFVSNRTTGKQHTSRSRETRLSPRQRYDNAKRKGKRRV